MIRQILYFLPSLLFSFDFQGYVGVEYRAFENDNTLKRESSRALEAKLELKKSESEYSFYMNSEFLKDKDENSRSYARVNELYLTKHFENSDFSLGRRIYFMGALEVLNPVDVISRQNFERDLLDDRYRIGTYMALYEHYLDSMQVSFMSYGSERADEFGDIYSPYNVFSFPLSNDIESQKNDKRASFMLKVQGTLDEEYALDYAFGLIRGYDTQRTFTQELKQKQWLATTAFIYNTLAYENSLLKLEAKLSDIDKNSEAQMDDHLYVGVGVEHTLAAIYKSMDVGLLLEYYNWITLKEKYSTPDKLMVLMQNDLFVGLRIALNNASSTEIVGGAIFDIDDSSEQSYYAQIKSRIFDTFMVDLDVRHLNPSDSRQTLMALMGEHSRFTLNLRYYF